MNRKRLMLDYVFRFIHGFNAKAGTGPSDILQITIREVVVVANVGVSAWVQSYGADEPTSSTPFTVWIDHVIPARQTLSNSTIDLRKVNT
jgi:hypothetical protein